MTIQAAIEGANDLLLAGVDAIFQAHDYPPGRLADEKTIISYYGGGTSETISDGIDKDLFNIICEYHVFRKDLVRDITLLMDSIDDIKDTLLADTTLGGTASTFGFIEISKPIGDVYNGKPTLKLQFIIRDVKINS